jgi:hypothetical protein
MIFGQVIMQSRLISDSLVPFSGDELFSPLSVVIFGLAEFLGF